MPKFVGTALGAFEFYIVSAESAAEDFATCRSRAGTGYDHFGSCLHVRVGVLLCAALDLCSS